MEISLKNQKLAATSNQQPVTSNQQPGPATKNLKPGKSPLVRKRSSEL